MTDTPNQTARRSLVDDLETRHDRLHKDEPPIGRPPGDMWRVDVAGYSCSVRGKAAKDHLEAVDRNLARMKLALRKLAWRDDDAGRVARLALEGRLLRKEGVMTDTPNQTAAMPSSEELTLIVSFLETEVSNGRWHNYPSSFEASRKTAAWLRRLIAEEVS